MKRLYYRLIKREYVHITLDLSKGDAYEYYLIMNKKTYPTIIRYGRLRNGKYQSGVMSGDWSIQEADNIHFRIKRGFKL